MNSTTPIESAVTQAVEGTPADLPANSPATPAAPVAELAPTSSAEPISGQMDPSAESPAEPVIEAAAGEASAVALAPASPGLTDPEQCAQQLRERFPALFGAQPLPLKLHIQADIHVRAPDVFARSGLTGFFRRYTGSTRYLNALVRATHRFDLDGQPAGEVSAEHKQVAEVELERRRQLVQQRRALEAQQRREQMAAERKAEREAQKQAQAQAQEQDQARQQRAQLLRDFERTTLTPANFSALKGLAPQALEETLKLAREEAKAWAAQRAQARPPGAADDRAAGRPGQALPNGPRGPRGEQWPRGENGHPGRGGFRSEGGRDARQEGRNEGRAGSPRRGADGGRGRGPDAGPRGAGRPGGRKPE